MNFEVGSTIGDYRVIEILGAGGMGKVYKVRNTITDRVEAMKVLLPDLAGNTDLADRFQREIRVQASLEHPNIASLHTALRVENQLLMLMEYVEGVTLEEKLKGGPLPVTEAAGYIRQVLDALEYAHAHGVVHRDIKPANMMLTPAGVVKLMDFGIAKAAADRRLTMTGTTMGSLYYMSPEQIQGAATLDARADLYSVGVSLYEMVTGKHAFEGDSQYSIMAAHLEKTPVPPIQLVPGLPEALSEAILIAVARDPEKRFQTAAAFRNALASCVSFTAPQPVPAVQPAAPQAAPPPRIAAMAATATMAPGAQAVAPATPRPPRSRRWLWMAAGAVAAALAVIAAIEFVPKRHAQAEPQATAAPQQAAQSEPAAAVAPQNPPAQNPPAESVPGTPPAQTASTPAAPAAEQKPPALGRAAQPARQLPAEKPRTATAQPQQPPPQQPPPAMNEQAKPPQAAQPQAQPPAAPAQAAAARAQMQQTREDYMLLNARANGIRTSLDSLRRSQAASGLNMSSRFSTPAELMDQYLSGAAAAIHAGDTTAARDFLEKAERQVEILEKLLNR